LNIINQKAIQTAALEFDVSLYFGDFYLIDSQIIGNNVSFYAVISSFYFTPFNLYFFSCKISENHGNSVGAAYAGLHMDGLVYFNNTLFQNNIVDNNTFFGGSSIFIYALFSTQFFTTNCTYIDNYSSQYAGAVAILAGILTDYGSNYIGNSAELLGGALDIESYSQGTIIEGFFFNNSGSYGAGAAHFNCIVLILNNCQFQLNSAQEGAVLVIEADYPCSLQVYPFIIFVFIFFERCLIRLLCQIMEKVFSK